MPHKNLLLTTDSARAIFAEIESLPVFDIHTHVDLPMVLENAPAPDAWTALCKGDHYVTSIIESLGAMDREAMFSPSTDPYDKWLAYATIFPDLLGNQIRDWMRMTLRSLGVTLPFNRANAQAIWTQLRDTLQQERWRPQGVFMNSNIRLMATTNHPTDTLEEHVRAAKVFGEGYWIPTWRPDALFNLQTLAIAPRRWRDWLRELAQRTDLDVEGHFNLFKEALARRHDFFARMGCRAADYGMFAPYGHAVTDHRARSIFRKACAGREINDEEAGDFLAHMLRFSMEMDYAKGWISQIHYGVARNQRDLAARLGGLDSGCDTIHGYGAVVESQHNLLNHFDAASGRQHKIFLYALSKADWEKIAGLSRIFPSVYAGMSWWYFDSISGMLEYFRTMPDMGAGLRKIGPFVTDARNIYTLVPRTQIYRRCLSTVLGEFVEQRGDSLEEAIDLAKRVSCYALAEMMEREVENE